MLDCAGFYAFRRYPASTQLAEIVTKDGRPAVRCYLAFIVLAPAKGSTVSRVELKAWFLRRWTSGRIFSTRPEDFQPSPGDPNAPSAQSAAILARTRKPIDLDAMDAGGFIYDHREDAFLDGDGNAVTPIQMLDEMYTKHCRTLRLGFRLRWSIGSAARWAIHRAVWRGQDAAMWALFTFYDVELSDKKLRESQLLNPLHKYNASDFRRVTDKPDERSHFFGFQSSQKSFFTNLIVVATTCLLLYWNAPLDGLLGWIYNNTALSTAALVLGFLLADTLGPWILIRIICALSRFRDAVLFFVRKVRV